MLRLAFAHLVHSKRRLVSILVAVAIGTAFTAAAVTFQQTSQADLDQRLAGPSSKVDVIVDPLDGSELSTVAREAAAASGVSSTEVITSSSASYRSAGAKGWLNVGTLPSPQNRWFGLQQGGWPTTGQLVITTDVAGSAGLHIGDQLTLQRDGHPAVTATISGIVPDLGPTGGDALIPAASMTVLGAESGMVLVRGAPGVDPDAVASAVSGATGVPRFGGDSQNGPKVLTASEFRTQAITAVTGMDVQQIILLSFAAIALLVAGIVVANVFSILFAARRRELALLRCVGAEVGQLRRQVLAESAVLGVIGSVLGVLIGSVLGAVAASVLQVDGAGVAISPVGLAVVLAVGIGLTMISASIPLRRAAAVSPLAALQPISTPEESRRVGRSRIVVGLALFVTGTAGLIGSVAVGLILPAVAGAALSAVGVIVLARVVLPVVLGWLSPLARRAGVPGTLAIAQARRAPARSAATSTALLVGVTLIVTLQVGAATGGATIDKALTDRFPVPLAVTDVQGKGLSENVFRTARTAGAEVGAVQGAMVTVAGGADGEGVDSDERTLALAPSADALRTTGLAGAGPGEVFVPYWWLQDGYQVGQPLTLTAGGRSVTLTVRGSHLADAAPTSSVVVDPAVLQQLSPTATRVALWAAVPSGIDAQQVESDLQKATVETNSVQVTGSAGERAQTQEILDVIVAVATAMLAVAVLIALVGVATTISLSVLERTRESALLRALGLSRNGLRSSIAVEALALTAVGVICGVILGIGYGFAGSAAILGQAEQLAVYRVPLGSVALVVGVGLLAGLLAAVLPARRAARVAPAAALADLG